MTTTLVERAETLAADELRALRRPDGLKGIYLHRASGLWAATIMADGVKRSLGYFKTANEAHAAYAAAARNLHGHFARTR